MFQVSATSCGRIVPARPRRAKVTESSISVGFGLIWMVVAPALIAVSVKEAAGCTSEEVPMQKKTSHCLADSRADAHAPSGNASPNQEEPGRIRAPQDWQRGGSMRSSPPSAILGVALGKTWDCRQPSQ